MPVGGINSNTNPSTIVGSNCTALTLNTGQCQVGPTDRLLLDTQGRVFLWRDLGFCDVYGGMKKAVFKLFWLLLCVLILEGCGQRQGRKTTDRQAPEIQTQGSGRQGVLSYETGDAGVTITGCQESAEGEVVIPDEIAGLPVISIGFEPSSGAAT